MDKIISKLREAEVLLAWETDIPFGNNYVYFPEFGNGTEHLSNIVASR